MVSILNEHQAVSLNSTEVKIEGRKLKAAKHLKKDIEPPKHQLLSWEVLF